MGNDCKSCQNSNAEQELIIGSGILKNENGESLDHVKNKKTFLTFKEIINNNPEQYKKLHKILNSILSFQKRKMFKNMLKKFREEQKHLHMKNILKHYQKIKNIKNQKKKK